MAEETAATTTTPTTTTTTPATTTTTPATTTTAPATTTATPATTTTETQTPEQIKAAAATEAARVAALTPEQKTAEAKAATDKAAADKAANAPIDYKGLKLPEGQKVDDPVFGEALKLFGDNKISAETAQKLLDFTVTRDQQLVKAVNDANTENWTKMRGEWKADTEKNVSAEDRGSAKQFAEKLFDKKTAEMLEAYGLTDHRGFVEAMVKAGKAIKDDTLVTGNAAVNGAGSDARAHFPKSNMNP